MTEDRKIGSSAEKRAGNRGKGRPKGARNKTTVAMKEAIMCVYNDLQEEAGRENGHFVDWAKENPTEFYKIASKLIPIDLNANIDGEIGMRPIEITK